MATVPDPIDPLQTPGMCGGPSPHFLCPERAKETGLKGAALGALLGHVLAKRSRNTDATFGAAVGAALGGGLSWWLASGRWWV